MSGCAVPDVVVRYDLPGKDVATAVLTCLFPRRMAQRQAGLPTDV